MRTECYLFAAIDSVKMLAMLCTICGWPFRLGEVDVHGLAVGVLEGDVCLSVEEAQLVNARVGRIWGHTSMK